MPSNHLIGDWNKTPVWTIGTPDSRLLTDAPNPFVCASRRIPPLSGSFALEADGKNVRSTPKQRPEQPDLSLRRRILGDQLGVLIQMLQNINELYFNAIDLFLPSIGPALTAVVEQDHYKASMLEAWPRKTPELGATFLAGYFRQIPAAICFHHRPLSLESAFLSSIPW